VGFIRWEDLDPETVERAVKVLLLDLYPGARPINGSGGDKGRDVRWDSPEGLVIFEIKSYARQLTPKQQREVTKSLTNAAAHHPVRWVLVMPCDHSPAKEAWFDDLIKAYPAIALEWWGRTWLDLQFGKRGYLRRYVEGESHELLLRAQEFDREQAALVGGMTDAMARLVQLWDRANELSLFWIAEVTLGDGTVQVAFRERYPGAAVDDPVIHRPVYLFPADDPHAVAAEQQLNDFNDYGGMVEIDGRYVIDFQLEVSEASKAMLAPMAQGRTERLTFTSEVTKLEHPLVVQLATVTPDGKVAARLPLQTQKLARGRKGVRLTAADATGMVTMIFTCDDPQLGNGYRTDISIVGIAGKHPYAIRPTFDVFAHLERPGARLELRINNDIFPCGDESTPLLAEARLSGKVIAALDQLQNHTGQTFPVPGDLTYEDASDLIFAARLINGETVRAANTELGLTICGDKLADFLTKDAGFQVPGALVAEFSEYRLCIGAHQFNLGTINVTAPRMKIVNLPELQAAAPTGSDTTARYQCADGEGINYRLGPLTEQHAL
jgi:hypothetical protein